VLLAGFLLGGTVGLGTVLYALTIGPVVHLTLPAFSLDGGARRGRGSHSEGTR
jgi:uncharacterized membrane protein YczE